jgi:hypothetical protein
LVNGEVDVVLLGQPGTQVELFGAVLDGTVNDWEIIDDFVGDSAVTLDEAGRARTTVAFSVANPKLWSPDVPNLYFLWIAALVDGLSVDDVLDRIGFRDIAVSGNDILLNGSPIFLKGVTRHDLYEATGFFGTEEQMEDDMARVKQMGANYVRLIHYPHHPKILELADELGLMVSCEIPAWANFLDPEVLQKLYTMYEEMILRDMNHPSVIMWLSGNSRARPMPYAKEAQELAKSLDQNRLASYVLDNEAYDPESMAADLSFLKEANLDVYMKITFWVYYPEILHTAWPNFPADLPTVIAEFSFEGNDRDAVTVLPLGEEYDASEAQQASALRRVLEVWRPYLPFYAGKHIGGLTLYNWQDIQLPNIELFRSNHIPSLHFGLVYEDREEKTALETLSSFLRTLPTEFVGSLRPAEVRVEDAFTNVENLSAVVNSPNRELGASLSGSGGSLYLATDGPDFVGAPKLVVANLTSGWWQEPRLLEIPEETEPFAFRRSPCMSYDERTLYFARAVLSGLHMIQARTRLWSSQFVAGLWLDPVDMGDVVNTDDPLTVTSDPSVTIAGDVLYFASDRTGGFGELDIWVTHRVDGEWQIPQNLGAAVNSAADETEPAVSADGNTLYFSSDRPGGFGSSDLWVSHRIDGEWSEPKNLGAEVNTVGAEREPEVSKDDKYLLFSASRDGGYGLNDIWLARRPGAQDLADLSSALAIEVTSNNPGSVVVVTPSDLDHRADGTANPSFVRRYRPGTAVTLMVPPTYNGFAFWRWENSEQLTIHGETSYPFTVEGNAAVKAMYVIPVSVSILGADQLHFDGDPPSASRVEYEALAAFIDGSTQTLRSGLAWSVDNEQVAVVDPVTGVFTPRPMDGEATVTLFVQANIGGLELPVASKIVHLYGKVTVEPTADDSVGRSGGPSLCRRVNSVFAIPTIMGQVALSLLLRRRLWLRYSPFLLHL